MEAKTQKLLDKRERLLEKLAYFHAKKNNIWNLRNWDPKIQRATNSIHKINEELYMLLKIDKKYHAL